MARIRRHCQEVAAAFAVFACLFLAPAFGEDQGPNAGTDLYDRPVLAVDPGMHTSTVWSQAVDRDGKYAVTGSADKTVRIWSIADGKLLRTIWLPLGPDPVGQVFAVAISPDGTTIAAGGWTESLSSGSPIYLFDRASGSIVRRIHEDLPDVSHFLTFSPDGRYLLATVDSVGLRVFDRNKDWSEVFRDDSYQDESYGAAFAADGRLATTSLDGMIRLYEYDPNKSSPSFRSARQPARATSGHHPFGIAFSPDGKRLAVGYQDVAAIDVLDGTTLERMGSQTPANLDPPPESLSAVAWSHDGSTLFAAGNASDQAQYVVMRWEHGGLGEEQRLGSCGVAGAGYSGINTLPDQRILMASYIPCLGLMDAHGDSVWTLGPRVLDFRGQKNALRVSRDGKIVDFSYVGSAGSSMRFDTRSLSLSNPPPNDGATYPPDREGLTIDGWESGTRPTLRHSALALRDYEMARSLAIAPDAKRFFLGTSFGLIAFDDAGAPKWRRPVGGETWAVNASKDGRVVVAAEADGTIRWYRADDGRELLALQVLPNETDWVLWTPEGFYHATDGAQDVLKWVTNHGPDKAATAVPVSKVSRLHRSDALRFVIDELSTKGALGAADLAGARLAVQAATGSAKPPGAVLHVLAIGVDQFGLQYAADDARGVADALSETQKIAAGKASLYADVTTATLVNEGASRIAILEAVDDLTRSMRKSVDDQDVAVILFSGHGEMIENKYYLIPYGVDVSTPTKMETSSVWIEEFAAKIKVLAQRGRVLLLFDACHSGAVGPGGESPVLDAGVLRDALNSNNITVLTSSDKDEESREDPAWKHGAFTKAFLDALAGGADLSSRGVISTGELAVAMRKEVSGLSGGKQHLGMRMNFADDVFVTGQ